MRVCFVVHGLPPEERGGVEQCTVALADELARRGHDVEVFAPWRRPELPDRSLRRERRRDWHADRINVTAVPADALAALAPPGVADAFARFIDAERPDVVHVQHVLRLGVGVVDAAADAGVPVVYTAHDWFSITDRYALLRPDLSRFGAAPTPEDEASCDLAGSILNAREELGDWHLGVPPEWLPEDVRARIAETRDGDPLLAGFSRTEWNDALERRRAVARRRRASFERVDAFVAPSRFLAEWVREAYGGTSRVLHQPNGIDVARLADVPPVDATARTVRLAFVGGLTKHKGAHVLLEAYARLGDRERERLPLTLYGDSTDRAYVARIAARAKELGATWAGAYDSEDLAPVFSTFDVLVVPSIWYENFPTVVREAFAAGRPAVASDLGALPESVRDGVDGLLFEPGDPDALAAALRRFLDEPGLLGELVRGLPAVRTIAEQVDELETLYTKLASERRDPRDPGGGLPHLTALGARWRALDALPTRELLMRCTRGLTRLADIVGGGDLDPALLVAEGVGEGSRSLEELRDRRDEAGYLMFLMDERERRAAWLADRLEGVESEIDWLRGEREGLVTAVDFHARSTEALQKERDWLRSIQETLEKERSYLRDKTQTLDKERTYFRSKSEELDQERTYFRSKSEQLDAERTYYRSKTEELARERERLASENASIVEQRAAERAWLDSLIGGLEQERDWLKSMLTSRDEEREWLKQLLTDREEELVWLFDQVESNKSDLAELRRQVGDAERAVRELVQVWTGKVPPPDDAGAAAEEPKGHLDKILAWLVEHGRGLAEQIDALRAAQDVARRELDWRRTEMELAQEALERRTVAWLTWFTGVGKRIAAWRGEEERR
ncbi:MAG: glycosyltransferase [Planctomycetota bacterium]